MGAGQELITTPSEASRYYLCPLQKIDLRVGGDIFYGLPDQILISGNVLEIETHQIFSHSFRFGPSTDLVEGTSCVNYLLTAMQEMTELRLLHDRFGDDEKLFADVVSGWPAILSGLKTLAETGKTLPWPAAAAAAAAEK
jgi:hypothetical protein